MNKIVSIIIIVFTFNISHGQNFSELKDYEFKIEENYKTEEDKVLQCANYLVNNSSKEAELNRLTALQYIIKWMSGTPDYTFEIGNKAMELTKGNSDLLGLYMVAMTKVVLDNKSEKLNNDAIYNQSEEILVNYCSNSDNKMKPSKRIKKILKSKKNK